MTMTMTMTMTMMTMSMTMMVMVMMMMMMPVYAASLMHSLWMLIRSIETQNSFAVYRRIRDELAALREKSNDIEVRIDKVSRRLCAKPLPLVLVFWSRFRCCQDKQDERVALLLLLRHIPVTLLAAV